MQKVKLGLRGLNPKQKAAKARKLEQAIMRNTFYKKINRTRSLINELTTSRKALEKAIEIAEYGDKRALAARTLCDKNLDDKIRLTAAFVEAEAAGDEELIEAAGFELRKRNNRPKKMSKPEALKIKRTAHSGEIALSWSPVANSKNYFIQLATRKPAKEKDWTTRDYSTKSKCLLKNLKPGKVYHVRVLAIGARGIGPPGDTTSFMAT